MTQNPEHQSLSRRELLQLTGAAAGGGALLAATSGLGAARAEQLVPTTPIPPHREIAVNGIHAYADRLSVKPGDTINFHVSSDRDYAWQIHRLGLDPDTPDCDLPMSVALHANRLQQPIHPGSYVHVQNGLTATGSLTAVTLECWVRPFVGRPKCGFSYSGVITQFDLQNAGYGLFVRFDNPDRIAAGACPPHAGSVAFYLGDGDTAFDEHNPDNLLEVPMDFLGAKQRWSELEWHHIVATWDG